MSNFMHQSVYEIAKAIQERLTAINFNANIDSK
jgi:hypothetical protein